MSEIDSTRTCNRCAAVKPIEEFVFRNKATGVRRTICSTCSRQLCAEHYEANKQPYIERAAKNNKITRKRKKQLAGDLKSQPCMDCGKKYPRCCMQFDHRQGRVIKGHKSPELIANMTRDFTGMPRFRTELEKCDLVCANCHCIRTHQRRKDGWQEERAGV